MVMSSLSWGYPDFAKDHIELCSDLAVGIIPIGVNRTEDGGDDRHGDHQGRESEQGAGAWGGSGIGGGWDDRPDRTGGLLTSQFRRHAVPHRSRRGKLGLGEPL